MRVPGSLGRREFSTRTGMSSAAAGSMVFGCSTLAPNVARISASSYEIDGSTRACETKRGSAEKTPSTSVQISISSASRQAPTSAAE